MRTALVAALLVLGRAGRAADAGELTFKVDGAGDAVFSHALHVGKGKLGCEFCHPRLFAESRATERVTMQQMEAGRSCGSCHDVAPGGSAAGCARCHK